LRASLGLAQEVLRPVVVPGPSCLHEILVELGYQPTTVSTKAREDLLLGCRVQAAGAAHPTTRAIDIKAQADGGIVRVHGIVDEAELLGEILELVRIVPEVKKEISALDIRPIFPYLAVSPRPPHHCRRSGTGRWGCCTHAGIVDTGCPQVRDGPIMPTQVLMNRLTDEGRKTVEGRPDRIREVNQELEGMGVR